MSNRVTNSRSRCQRKVNDTKLSVQTTSSFLRYKLTNASDFEGSLFNSFRNHTDIAVTHRFQSILNNARTTYAYIDYSFRFSHTVESTCHKGVVRYGVAEDYQFRTTDSIAVSSTSSSHLHYFTHLFYSVHIDTAFGRTNAYRRTNNVSYSQRFRNRSNQISVAFGVAFIYQCRKTTNEVYAYILRSFIKSLRQRNIVIGVTAFANHGNGGYGNAFVNNGHAQFKFQIFASFYKVFCLLANLIINFLRSYLHIGMSAVTQANAHSDGAHVQFVFGNHACSF